MRIKKVEETPIPAGSAEIVDGYSESTTNGYSCNYINGLATKNSARSSNYRTSDLVINGNSDVDIVSVNITTTGKPLLVSFTIPMRGAGNGSPLLKVYVDSTQKFNIIDSFSSNHLCTHTIVLTDITAGSHTVTVKGSKGNDTSLTIVGYTGYNLQVTEL